MFLHVKQMTIKEVLPFAKLQLDEACRILAEIEAEI